ncbi:1189_t:CDS:2, partial [Diversispora eburnea]
LDNVYSNFQVKSTSPSINATIPTSTDRSNITITYYEPVERFYGNISIYQIDKNGNTIIRQFVNGVNSFCSISDNGLTVTVNVLKSTFSNPNSQFYIKVDNDFVRSKAYRESLRGIYDNIWKFNTSSREETFADKIYGVLRLTKEGTEYYENLNSTGKDKFFTDLRLELSEIIPVNIKRLSSNGEKTQVDTTINSGRKILISLNIESSKEERSADSILNDLNDMITYKNMTSIDLFPTTKYLDGDFGFKPTPALWGKYKWKFLGVMLVLAILVVLFLIAKKIESKGHNIAILQLGLIIFDFAMDVLFVSKNGKVIEVLYIPSYENKSKAFLDWFSQNEKVASVFTVLSSADIETLSILHSNMAGFKFFQAPFSTKGKNRIFWASCLAIFVEDIPQVIIQLIYYFRVVTYDIIPLLSLVSSCLSLLINIIGRLFQAINTCRPGILKCDSSQNQDDFESLHQLQTPATERSSTSDESISHSVDVKEENEKK